MEDLQVTMTNPIFERDSYTQRLEGIGAVRSVGSKGDSYDNAAAEAVNSLYKKELINHEGPWQDAGQVTVATAEWVSWYNDDRLHSACGNIPPAGDLLTPSLIALSWSPLVMGV